MWGCNLSFTRCHLFESTNSLVSLAPTRRKNQFLECSNTNWMEAPTSSYTGSNLYSREQLFSLAPPCHLGFLAATRWKLQLHVFKHLLETLRTTVLPSISLPPWNINLFFLKFITVIQHLSMAYRSHHYSALPTSVSLSLHLFLFLLFSQICIYVPFFFYTLCSVSSFHSMHHTSSVHFSSCTQHASTRMNHTQQQQPYILYYVYIYHDKSSTRSSTQLIIFFGGYAKSVRH